MTSSQFGTAVAAALCVAACSSPDDTPGEMHLVVVQSPVTVTAGQLPRQSVVVRVVNTDGSAMSGIPVRWNVQSGGGTVRPAADTSGLDGLATAEWYPGLLVGTQQLSVSIYDQPVLTIGMEARALLASKIAPSVQSGCGIRDRAVWCWAYGRNPVTRRALPQVEAYDLAVDEGHVCALDQGGVTHCQDFLAADAVDIPVQGLPALTAISGSFGRYCGISQVDQTPWCWQQDTWTAGQISSSLQFTSISAAPRAVCGLTATGDAWCAGASGILSPVPGGHAFRAISAGVRDSCAIEAPTNLYCWSSFDPAPALVTGITTKQVSMGVTDHVLIGSVQAQAFMYGALTQAYLPGPTFPLPVSQVSAVGDTPCVVAYDLAVYCLGVTANIDDPNRRWEAVPAPDS